jgi:hypothetical protein
MCCCKCGCAFHSRSTASLHRFDTSHATVSCSRPITRLLACLINSVGTSDGGQQRCDGAHSPSSGCVVSSPHSQHEGIRSCAGGWCVCRDTVHRFVIVRMHACLALAIACLHLHYSNCVLQRFNHKVLAYQRCVCARVCVCMCMRVCVHVYACVCSYRFRRVQLKLLSSRLPLTASA